MEKILSIDTVSDYNRLVGVETKHPLVSVINLEEAKPMRSVTRNFGFYAIFLKNTESWDLYYGRQLYDIQDRTLIFFAPGQINTIQNGEDWFQPGGNALLFQADLIHGTPLGQKIQEYSFFSYGVNEGLHLSEKERSIVLGCFSRIEEEINRNTDGHSKSLIVGNIELLLDYCLRFYDRQFANKENEHNDIIVKFDELLNAYWNAEVPQEKGLPSVRYFSDSIHLSPNYFGDLVKRITGKTAREYIQLKLIDLSKERLLDPQKSIGQIADELGFKYPQHFTRFFKQKTGMTPKVYRELGER